MKSVLISSAIAVYFAMLPIVARSQRRPPTVFIDKGACPFECCTYRMWKTEKTTTAYARPDRRSKQVGHFIAGTQVVALTGQVRTVAGRFIVMKTHEEYEPGLFGCTPTWAKGSLRFGLEEKCLKKISVSVPMAAACVKGVK